MNNTTYGFIGLGLIGGSIARAIKENEPSSKIIAYTPHKDTVDTAHAEGIIDTPLYEIGADFSDCDYIFLCAPVECNNDNILHKKQKSIYEKRQNALQYCKVIFIFSSTRISRKNHEIAGQLETRVVAYTYVLVGRTGLPRTDGRGLQRAGL